MHFMIFYAKYPNKITLEKIDYITNRLIMILKIEEINNIYFDLLNEKIKIDIYTIYGFVFEMYIDL